MNDLDQRVLELIRASPGQQARHIAEKLGVDRKSVNASLYGRLRGRVRQDSSYRWHLNEAAHAAGVDQAPIHLNTPLARLSRYYLDCLSHDDLGGVSEFAASKYGDVSYVELPALPTAEQGIGDALNNEAGRSILARMRRDRNRQTIFLGYPVRLNLLRSRKGWEGFMVEPLLLFSVQEADVAKAQPSLADDLPQLNFRALQALSNAGEGGLLAEAIQLSDDLGLGNAAVDQPDLEDLLARLREIRPDWDWLEEINPRELSRGKPLSAFDQQGILNRAVLVVAERSPYTKGLESELGMLQAVPENQYRETALGSWLCGQPMDSPGRDQSPLLEVVPLNTEQRQAVRQALTNNLTVITGPPGTGKSQVVTSILVNAAWQGKTVLFASKNNKAVDVVEARVNALGPRPVLLRLGASEYQSKLASYLVSLLAASATVDDHETYRHWESTHRRLQERLQELDAEVIALIALRNDVDRLEQEVEQIRQETGEEKFRRLRIIDWDSMRPAAARVQVAIDRANRAKVSFGNRLIWPFLRNARFSELAREAESFRSASEQIGLSLPRSAASSGTMVAWAQYGQRLGQRIPQVDASRQYFSRLDALAEARGLEDLSKKRNDHTEELSENSEALWQAWLRLQPSRLNPEERKLLGDYSALLQMIVSANDQDRRLGRDVFRRYYQLFPKIAAILSCWAVTSLSARGRLPFDPNFFDLLVIDEASQCDIASALPLLYRARRAVIIGDPMQLRHISTLSKQQDQQLLSKHGLVDEYPGWAYSPRSLFDLASGLCQSEDIVGLRDHHRSHADIIEFSNRSFYEGRLRVATRYDRLRFPRTSYPVVRWVDVTGKTVRPGNGGAVNEEEAMAVVRELERLMGQGYRGSIGVVSPFRAQANRIRDLVHSDRVLVERIAAVDFLADTVHRFQGDERDVMIFSPVVSSGVGDGALGFLRANPNLFNVAVTRARAALIVVGDKAVARNCGVDYLARFAEYTDEVAVLPKRSERVLSVDSGPDYPAVSHPDRVSDWERRLYSELYANGLKTIPQYSVEKYVLDLALVDGERRLDIEVDGERYHRNWDGELCRRDQIRNQRLMELGWDVMRFWVYQIRDDLPRCVERVQEWMEKR